MKALQTKYNICDDIMDYIYWIIFTDNYNEVVKEFNKKMDIDFLVNIEIDLIFIDFDFQNPPFFKKGVGKSFYRFEKKNFFLFFFLEMK